MSILSDWWRNLNDPYGHGRWAQDVDVTKLHRRISENTSPDSIIELTSEEYRALIENPMPARPEQSLIDDIFAIRVRNNIPWKRLIEIAMKHAPEETKAALRDINANDRAISDLMTELAK